MHDIWNPWHGCVKCSEGCEHCYMYFLDRLRDHDGREIYKTRGVMCAPFIGLVSLRPWLASGQIERVKCGGENYDG